jgi:hypothetical protein
MSKGEAMTGQDAQAVPHPSEYILEEMAARGWTRDHLALAMCADRADEQEWSIWRLAVDLYFAVGPGDCNLRINPEAFARAFGVSEQFFVNLEQAWLRSVRVQ